MDSDREYTGFVHAGGTCSWDVGSSPSEAASNAVKQWKRDFRHIFKIKKGVEYKVNVFDTTGMTDWIVDDFGYVHNIKDGKAGDPIKDFEVIKVLS